MYYIPFDTSYLVNIKIEINFYEKTTNNLYFYENIKNVFIQNEKGMHMYCRFNP